MIQRIAFFICGVMTALIGRVFGRLERFAPTNEISWSPFSLVLLVVGVLAICISLLPGAWLRRVTSDNTEGRHYLPTRWLVSFAAIGLLLEVIINFIPPQSGHPQMGLLYSLCPACVLTVTVDPSLTTALFALAPLNALVFGAFGGVIGTAVGFLRRQAS